MNPRRSPYARHSQDRHLYKHTTQAFIPSVLVARLPCLSVHYAGVPSFLLHKAAGARTRVAAMEQTCLGALHCLVASALAAGHTPRMAFPFGVAGGLD